MSISGFNPTSALPTLASSGMLAGSNPLLAAPGTNSVGGSSLLGAQLGVQEKPGILTRFSNAMKAAIGELRGGTPASAYPTTQLALSAPAPVAVSAPKVAPKKGVKGKTFTDKQGNLRQVGTGKVLKAAVPKAAMAPTNAVPAQQQLDAYVKSLRDHAAFLAHDLNPSALDAIQEDVKTVARAAKELDFGLDACAVAARTYVAQNSLPSGTATATPTR